MGGVSIIVAVPVQALFLPSPSRPQNLPFHVPKQIGTPARKTFKQAYLLDVVIAQRAPILELLPREDQTLLVRRDALFVLDLGLDVVDGVAGFDLEGDGLTREGFDEAILV